MQAREPRQVLTEATVACPALPWFSGDTFFLTTYAIQKGLGRGGMGMVYKDRHLRLNRFEAMKRMAPHLQGNPEMVMRLLREAEAAGRLDHPSAMTKPKAN